MISLQMYGAFFKATSDWKKGRKGWKNKIRPRM
jgi:hypothetical protein